MKQYTELLRHIISNGTWIENTRTEKKCKTIINYDLEYDFFPIVTTRKSYWKAAVAEFMGYIKGYTSAADFRAMGTKTWDANANENQAWLNNPYRKGEDDMGRVYGAQGRDWKTPKFYSANINNFATKGEFYDYLDSQKIDQLRNVYEDLRQGIDNRGEIISFYNVGEIHMGCLRPCVLMHQFSLLDGTLYLNSYQRSCDVPLGLNFNMVQCYFFLQLMAQITGHKPGKVYHKIVNAHIYEDQFDLAFEESGREPIECNPTFTMSKDIKTFEHVEAINHVDELGIRVQGYDHHPAIKYPMTA